MNQPVMPFDPGSIPSAWRGHEDFAAWLVEACRPAVICELGADFGFSAIALARPGIGHVFTIDSFEGDEHAGFRNAEDRCRENAAASGCANLTVIKDTFDHAAQGWDRPIDILHIDGRHGFSDVKNDFDTWFPFVRPGGVVLFHDTLSFPGAVGAFFAGLPFPKFNFEHSHGLGVLVKPHGLPLTKGPPAGCPASGGSGAPPVTKCPPSSGTGLVIGTFAALPYVHLQLEARRRFYPDVPALVHDDGSRQGAALERLAHAHGAEFITHPVRHNHHLGDLSVYPAAFAWASRRGLRRLLKVSRRWIWRVDWRESLEGLFRETQAPTLSNFTASYGFGFRTECVAFDLNHWNCPEFLEDVQERIDARGHVFVENYLHVWAARLSESGTPAWQKWREDHPVPPERGGYAPWELMGTCRQSRHPSRLWHDSDSPEDYAALAASWGLPYTAGDFGDPNAGEGTGQASC